LSFTNSGEDVRKNEIRTYLSHRTNAVCEISSFRLQCLHIGPWAFFVYRNMGILQYNEASVGRFIVHNGAPHEVLESRVFRMQQRKPVNATKLRNLITGNIVQHSFQVSDKVDEAKLEVKPITYLYTHKNQYWFCEANDPSKRFQLDPKLLGSGIQFIKTNSLVDAMLFEEKIIAVKLPIKVDLKVQEAPPAVKGNTAQGATKQITLETGTIINAPLFIKEGETVRVNTQTGQYVERA